MPDSIQFCVVRISTNMYRIIVQNEKEVLRSYYSKVAEVIDDVGHELEQLKSQNV